ncbi:iron complex outermembrane receptor protein [Oxalobacteraceae bacterium GrIS 2.11]
MKMIKQSRSPAFRMKPVALAIGMLQICATYAYAEVESADTEAVAVQAVDGTVKTASQTNSGIQEVIITARKVGEPISKTPLSITAVTGDDLRASGITNVSEIGDLVPNLVMGRDPFGVNINIRGVTTTDQTSKGTQGIGFNVDGVPIGRPLEQGLSFFDVERIEVLSGPQGTLYGTSTTGGAINIITNKPDKDFAASINTEFGSYNARRSDAMVNVPISNELAVRIAVNGNDRDGYLQPSLGANPGGLARNDQHDRAGRLSALYTFSHDTTMLLATTFGNVTGVGYGTVPSYSQIANGSPSQQKQVYGNPFGGDINDKFNSYNGEFNTLLGQVKMTVIASNSEFHAHELTSATFDPSTNADRSSGEPQYAWRNYRGDFNESNVEMRFTNANKSALQWVVGANYHNEKINESDHNLNAVVSNPTFANSTNGIDPLNTTTHKSSGIFGQGTYNFTDEISVLAGLRESNDSLTRVGTFSAGPTPGCTNPFADCIGGPNNGSESATKLTYRLGLNYQFNPHELLYTDVATGYKPGGFNDFDPATNGVGPYIPEELTAYEIGYKGRLSNNFQFNSDLFYYDYAKNQISGLTNVEGNFVIYTRAVASTISGWENSLKYKMSDADQITASLSMMHSKYGQFMAGLFQNVDFTGKSLDKTPSATATLGYTHTTEVTNGEIKTYLGTKYSSSYVASDLVGGVQYTQKAFSRSNANITYLHNSGKYSAQLFVTNIENKLQLTAAGSNNNFTVSEPRFIGVRFGVNY